MEQAQRIVRNFVKMTPGTIGGQSAASQPAMARTIGSRHRPARGTFGGESRIATPLRATTDIGRVIGGPGGGGGVG